MNKPTAEIKHHGVLPQGLQSTPQQGFVRPVHCPFANWSSISISSIVSEADPVNTIQPWQISWNKYLVNNPPSHVCVGVDFFISLDLASPIDKQQVNFLILKGGDAASDKHPSHYRLNLCSQLINSKECI